MTIPVPQLAISIPNWDGKELTINIEFPYNGKKMIWHGVWSGIAATAFTETGDVAEVGGLSKRAVTIHGTKLVPEAASKRKVQ